MKLGLIIPLNYPLEETTRTIFQRVTLANPTLAPERSHETEYGLDATLFTIWQLNFTWYSRRTNQELQQIDGPTGFISSWANIGNIANHGFEATANAKVLDTRHAVLDLRFSYAHNTNKVLSLGGASGLMNGFGGYRVGYPIAAAFERRIINYADTAGGGADGIITPTEVIFSDPQYLGVFVAPRTYTVTPSLSLPNARLRIAALFDGQRGGVYVNGLNTCSRSSYNCKALFLASTPLFDQALNLGNSLGQMLTSSNFTRWREFSVTGDLSPRIARSLHLSHASASIQVRNLALWTPALTISDPETVPLTAAIGGANAIGLPQPRTWTFRFDLTP